MEIEHFFRGVTRDVKSPLKRSRCVISESFCFSKEGESDGKSRFEACGDSQRPKRVFKQLKVLTDDVDSISEVEYTPALAVDEPFAEYAIFDKTLAEDEARVARSMSNAEYENALTAGTSAECAVLKALAEERPNVEYAIHVSDVKALAQDSYKAEYAFQSCQRLAKSTFKSLKVVFSR